VKTSKEAVLFISILLLGSVLLGSGCTDKGSKGEVGESRVVKAGDTVQVNYTGKLENGTIFDTSKEDVAKQAGIYINRRNYTPLEFVVGSGQMIQGFDKSIIGMKVGEEKTITVTPKEAYGDYDKNRILEVPIKQLNLTQPLKAGQTLYNQYGKFKVIDVNDTYVTLDTNHELAGKTLIFDIKLVSME